MKAIFKNKLFVLLSALIMLFCGVVGVKALKPKLANADKMDTPILTIESNNVSYAESIYILYAVSNDGFDRTNYEIKMLFWEEPQDDYVVGTEAYSVTSKQITKVNEKDCLVFYTNGLAAKEMTDNVYARACVEINGVTYYSAPSKFSVLEYVYTMREKGGLTSEQTAIFDAMLAYGAAAQNLFDYNVKRLANEDFYAVTVENGTLADGFDFGRFVYNETIRITANAIPDGQFFSHWENQSGSVISKEESCEITVTESDTYTAVYTTEDPEQEHTCITEGVWQFDAAGHWLACTCGEKVQYSEHRYGTLSNGTAGKAYYCVCGGYIINEDLVDFVVEVENGKDPVVLQLSDTQTWWWGDTAENQCYRYIREVVQKTQPDLIILTGDLVYGRFDPDGELLVSLINFMETLNIPWAPVFGNHDNESLMGVDWQCAQLEAAENCLFKQGDLTGNGNYSVGIEQDGELLRVFYMMDSNGCGKPMCDADGVQTTPAAGTNVVKTTQGFGQDQIDWYTKEINEIHALDADVKISMAYHIQQAIFEKAFQKYEEYDGLTTNSVLNNPLNLDTMETADDTDFGYLGRPMKGSWDDDYKIFNGMKALGVDSIFVGHEHCNSASIVYEGVRFQYGQKSSTYDRYNYVTEDGTITGDTSTPADAHALLGGTVIPVSSVDGSIGTGYICYYGDPFYFEPEPEEIVVNGLELSTDDLQAGKMMTLQALAFDETTNAYKITSGSDSAKLYFDTKLAMENDVFTFAVYIPENSPISVANEFMLRVKPDNTLTSEQGSNDGKHLYYSSTTNNSLLRVNRGAWTTVSVDISNVGSDCTEFALMFNTGAVVWVKDIAFTKNPEEIVVNGLELSTDDLQAGKTMTLQALAFDETTNAYKVTAAEQGKVYIDPALVANKTTFTFTVYVPEFIGTWAIAIRLKPNNAFPNITSSDGHRYYTDSLITAGAWQTFTIDISSLGNTCTEFSFVIFAGQTVWFRDIVIS